MGYCAFCLIYGHSERERENLFSENGSLTLINSSLTLLSNVFKLLCSKDKFVLPAHIVGAYTLEESGRLFRCEI